MNKYECQKALRRLKDYTYEQILDPLDLHLWYRSLSDEKFNELTEPLQELIDKFFPAKPNYCEETASYLCPYCNNEVDVDELICSCGQRLDWSEEW